jgi:succinyl-CoA synthetase alpha subunit
MSILVNEKTRLLVQGFTGREGTFHSQQMIEYGTNVVGGVTPGKGGQSIHGVPVYNSIREALREHDALASIVFVPAGAAMDSVMECAYAGLELIVAITEQIPVHDTMKAIEYARLQGSTVIGPNCPGLISPGECKLGIIPSQLATRGNVGVVSRSGTLTYEVIHELTRAGIGQSTVVGIGGDPVIGQTFSDVLGRFECDPETKAVVLIGEVGGSLEEEGAASTDLPIVAYIAGVTAPPEKRMGHAGAIIEGGEGDARSKIRRLEGMGIAVADRPGEIPDLIRGYL